MSEIAHEDILLSGLTQPTLVLLTAPSWCVPCQRFKPHWDAAKDKLENVKFFEIDLGETPEATQEHWAYELYDVRSVPTVILIWKTSPKGHPIVCDARIEARAVVPFVMEVRGHLE